MYSKGRRDRIRNEYFWEHSYEIVWTYSTQPNNGFIKKKLIQINGIPERRDRQKRTSSKNKDRFVLGYIDRNGEAKFK